MASCSKGEASRSEASPSPTRKNITGKPTVTPAMWGRVRVTPKRAPDEASITLLGPGVKAMTSEKIRTAVKVCGDMAGRLGQIGPFEVWISRMVAICAGGFLSCPAAGRGLLG